MAKDKVIIYEETGADPSVDLVVTVSGAGRTRVRAVSEAHQVVDLVRGLVDEGVDLVELCGGFGAVWHDEVARVVRGRVPLGAVYFGFESLTSVAAFKARFEAGEHLSELFIYVHEGADPAFDRLVREKPGGGTTTLVGVPDEAAAAKVAAELAADVQLIELYGGHGPAWARGVIDAVEAKVPVGVTGYAR
ncbi:DUF6506 family protein [Sinosporangium siamense]|uniref:Uncharacterized protein n=1 Tax=Sinosporangium siamense TaxID=1367973 RepID=A0A919RG27_9ACTN|nr:DUF6506 family protein [Sinosporangium siamense]GII92105.1 hypothetical protein Ssi02_23360 [Sinosporangium siamense]